MKLTWPFAKPKAADKDELETHPASPEETPPVNENSGGQTMCADTRSEDQNTEDHKPEEPRKSNSIEKQTFENATSDLLITAAFGYSIGLHREKNQDSVFVLTAHSVGDQRKIPFGLYIVADGMGGHELGEVASSSAIKAAATHVIEQVYMPFLKDEPVLPDMIDEILRQGVIKARELVAVNAPEGGTTLTMALIYHTTLRIAHIGDSRAYLIAPDNAILPLTRDHSLVKRLEELGQITPEEAAVHPQRNILYRAIGQGEQTEPEIASQPLPEDGFLLLCSDGLWGVLAEDEIANMATQAANVREACSRLIDAANNNGGPDNISVVLVHFQKN